MIEINSLVKAITPVDNKTSILFEKGKVIYLGRRVLIQFESNICGHNGNGLGKDRYCWMCDWNAIVEVN
jgi:hypothetical protein